MIAALPMYWRAETAADWRAFWEDVRAAAPGPLPPLTPPDALPADLDAHWRDPALVLSMTCGFPYRTRLHGAVGYVCTLSFGIDAAPGRYYSVVIGRPGHDPAAPVRLAVNSRDSQSGWACAGAPGPESPPLAVSAVVETGAHAASLAAVAEGRADRAYIDAVSWEALRRHAPGAEAVAVLGRTPATPGLPVITAPGRDPAPLRAALAQACETLPEDRRARLAGLSGIAVLDPADYLAVPDFSPIGASVRP